MKKFRLICLLVGMVTILCSCKEKEKEVPIKSNEIEGATYVSQCGPYGKLTVAVPKSWDYELCPVDSDELISGLYGIHIFPEGVEEGFIEIKYDEKFAVCGTELKYERANLAGIDVKVGTYGDDKNWSHIAFDGALDNIVAITYGCEKWWDKESDLSLAIVDSIKFDKNDLEGAATLQNNDSWVDKLNLNLTGSNVSNKGLVISYDLQIEKNYGEVFYGSEYIIEKKNDNTWEEIPVVVEGNYGFETIAYVLEAGKKSEENIDWEWLYGKLSPGEYRIKKTICEKNIESNKINEYEAYIYFVLR